MMVLICLRENKKQLTETATDCKKKKIWLWIYSFIVLLTSKASTHISQYYHSRITSSKEKWQIISLYILIYTFPAHVIVKKKKKKHTYIKSGLSIRTFSEGKYTIKRNAFKKIFLTSDSPKISKIKVKPQIVIIQIALDNNTTIPDKMCLSFFIVHIRRNSYVKMNECWSIQQSHLKE